MWPKKIEETVQRIPHKCAHTHTHTHTQVLAGEALMLAKRESFQTEQEQEQEDFIKSLDRIEMIISNFHKHDDVKNLEDIAVQAREVSLSLSLSLCLSLFLSLSLCMCNHCIAAHAHQAVASSLCSGRLLQPYTR